MSHVNLYEKHRPHLDTPTCVIFSIEEEKLQPDLKAFRGFLADQGIDCYFIPSEKAEIDADILSRYASFYCTGGDNRNVHLLYAKLEPAKRQGKVVVFGNLGRSLIFEKSAPRDLGLSIRGMFLVAAEVARFNSQTGSYAEFGVFDGRTVSMAWHNLKDVVDRFWCFDSFTGITGSADDETYLYADGSYSANIETFSHNMKVIGADLSRFDIIEGPFQTSLATTPPQLEGQKILIAHIDSDIEEACSAALDFLADKMLDNSIILFDDYHSFSGDNSKGERAALRKFLERNPHIEMEPFRNYGIHGASFFFRRITEQIRFFK